ncbi:MAG TPA: hypothetical protein DCK86_01810 [Rhodobacter sp.]|nr:MAG: hypothetical protein ABR99_10600 [Rhodobacter sp. BACL10 MAG-121220-bin24]KRO89841.1 MAG: hypothetical protein ABR89_07220 [Rhodobacter sp. BACL10 MAG-120910-bin24]HAG25544.1 hypothetical protein [Rhodobacter sp.]HCB53195.1 hypothetical protein [Rhodobacter sp.]
MLRYSLLTLATHVYVMRRARPLSERLVCGPMRARCDFRILFFIIVMKKGGTFPADVKVF